MSCFVLGLFVWVLFCFCLVVLVWFVLVEWSSHGDSSMDYVSILLSSTFGAHCRYNDVAIALIR